VPPNLATRVWLLAFGGALVLFVLTLAPDVLMMDSGEYQVAALRFPHLALGDRPADLVRIHPVYLAVARLVSFVPISNLAARVNFVSALFAAIAVANAALLTWWITRNAWAALLATLVLCFGHTLWAFAVIAEVMTMLAALLTVELLCWWLYFQTGRTRWLLALALLNGLGVATHLQLGLSTPIYVAGLLVLCNRRQLTFPFLLAWAAIWLIGTLPYSVIVAYYAVHTGDWHFILTSATYGRFGATPRQFAMRTLLRGLAAIPLNYPTLLILFAVPGVTRLRRTAPPIFTAILLGVLAIQLLFVLTYNVPDQYSFFVPIYPIAAVLIGVGAAGVLADRLARVALVLLAIMPVPIYAVAAPALRKANVRLFNRAIPYRDPYDFFIKPWKCGDRGQSRYVSEVFAQLPPDAVLLTSYTMEFMLEYGQLADNRRPDVLLVDDPIDLLKQLAAGADGKPAWRRPVFANDVEAKDFPAPLREQCAPHRIGLLWQLEPPADADALTRALLGQPPPGQTAPPSQSPPTPPARSSASTAPAALRSP